MSEAATVDEVEPGDEEIVDAGDPIPVAEDEQEPEAVEEPKPVRGPTGFIRVDHPALYPQKCVVCSSAKGPLIDTTHELGAGLGRIYLCSRCLGLCALEMGLVEGDRMEELSRSGEILDEQARAIADRDESLQTQLAELAQRARKIEALEELLAQERGTVRSQRHLLETINESAKQGLATA